MLQIQKWGNSLGIRIPKAIRAKVGLEESSDINMLSFQAVQDSPV